MKIPELAVLIAGLIGIASSSAIAADDDYYKQEPQFHIWPDPGAARYKISHFGPTGIGMELRQPAFTMHIVEIQEGSPAAASGELKKGQIIESVNGHVLKDEDPRVLLGNWITEAEAKDGVIKLRVKDAPADAAREVIVKIPALGAYSDTWPVNCAKSDKIVRNHADALAAHIDSAEIGLNGAVLFLLSTGEEKDLEIVRGWMKKFVEKYNTPEREVYPWIASNHLPNRRKDQATIEGGSGRNSNRPFGVTINDATRSHFADGEVLLAANGFLRWAHGAQTIKSYQAFWFEEMKLPELPPAPATPK